MDSKVTFTAAIPEFRDSPPDNFASAVTLSQRTEAIFRGLDLVLKLHGAKALVRSELHKQLHDYLDTSSDETVWLKRSKWTLAYPLAKYLKNEIPPQPDISFKPSGVLNRWMRNRLSILNRKNTHLWYSWFQAKRASLPMSEDLVEQTYEKHYATLTAPDPGDDTVIDGIFSDPTFQRVLEKVTLDVASKIDKAQFLSSTPSGSACFEASRKDDGQYGKLRRLSGFKMSFTTELVKMISCPTLVLNRTVFKNKVLEVREPYGTLEWDHLLTYIPDLRDIFSDGNCSAKIQGILEPFKVRVISKGNALPYYLCKPLQKSLLSSIQNFPCFKITGRPFCPTDVFDLSKKSSKTDSWLSIDYSAATDGLSFKYSSRIFNRIISDLPWEYQSIAKKVIGLHDLYYPTFEGGKVPRGTQTNGQLMGSILSFPILCLANLGVYLYNTQNLQRGWSDSERLNHVLVNGDDMVYSAPASYFETHSFLSGKVGLEMSVGKAYVHPVYLNINSTSVHYDLRKDNQTPWSIDYLNSGLFYGQHKVQGSAHQGETSEDLDELYENECAGSDKLQYEHRDDKPMVRLVNCMKIVDKTFSSKSLNLNRVPQAEMLRLLKREGLSLNDFEEELLLSSLNWILQGALPGKQAWLLREFLSFHTERVRSEQLGLLRYNGKLSFFSRNLFLPISLGGFGVNLPVGFKTKVTSIQKLVAITALRGNPELFHDTCLPCRGYQIQKIDTVLDVPWIRKVRDSEILQRDSDEEYYPLSDKYYLTHQNFVSAPNASCCSA